MQYRLEAAAALFAFDDDLTIMTWNEGAEELTGIPASDAVGLPCWHVLGGVDDAGGMICHRQCSRARLMREGRAVSCHEMNIRVAQGRRRVAVDTVAALNGSDRFFLHLLRDAPAPPEPEQTVDLGPAPALTPRQTEVLRLLDLGISARAIADKLGLTETTVRNHIRALLVELGAHSQLEAVFRARCHGLL
jgi:DNA-binding CsgD family transcriptional regulator